jgi:hypothetical protein
MKSQRSKGITFFGWLLIIASILGIIGSIKEVCQAHLHLNRGAIFNVIGFILYIICGIYILKLKEIARKALIFLSVFSIVLGPFYFNSLLKEESFEKYKEYHYAKYEARIIKEIKPAYQQKEFDNMKKSQEFAQKTLPFIFVIMLMIPLVIIELILIFFFTRPKIREQFMR